MRIEKPGRFGYLVLAFLIALGFSLVQNGQNQHIVKKVIDGVTIELLNGERVRYIGVRLPQFVSPLGDYAREAEEAQRRLIEGKKVRLEFDRERKDEEGRFLAYVYQDGLMINEWLVANGYLQAVVSPPNTKYADNFQKLEKEAREAGLGIWSDKR